MFDSIHWTVWGAGILILFPVLIILLGEMIFRNVGEADAHLYDTPLSILRNGVLPLAFIVILLRKLVELDGNHLAVKIADTALWIVALNAAVALLNSLFFRDGAQMAGRFQIPKLLLDLLRMFFVMCGAAVIVSRVWGVDLSSLITALGVGSVVIGLALQDTLGSLFAGIAMVSARQFRVGDWIRFGNEEGVVLSMNWRSVKIRTRAGDAFYLPNGIIARQPVTVLAGGLGSSVVPVEIKFPYEYSPDQITALLTEAARNTKDFCLDPAPAARVNSFDDTGIKYVVGVRTTDLAKMVIVRSEFLSNVWFAAQRADFDLTGARNSRFHKLAPTEMDKANDPAALAQSLTKLAAFRVAPDKLRRLVDHAQLEKFRTGEVMISQGKVAPNAYILVKGRARAVFAGATGAEVQLHEFEAGQLLMAKAQLQGFGMPFSFKAGTEIEVIAIPIADFKEFSLSDTALAREIEQILSAREDAANRALSKAFPDQDGAGKLSDRVQLMREMFRT
jgi:small-conductance mechanosensitive channel/CRP-like cAMP-binding protein